MEPLRNVNAGQTLTVTLAAHSAPVVRAVGLRRPVLRGRTRRPCGKPSPPGGRSVRTDDHPDRVLLAGDDGMGAAAVQVGLPDRAVTVVGPVQVAGTHRHPEGDGLAGNDDMRTSAVEVGLPDRALF